MNSVMADHPHGEEPVTPRSLPLVGERRQRLRYRDVAQALRCGLREAAAGFSFLRLKGLRSILKTLQSVAASEAATRLFRLSQASRELQVVPVLFENSFRKLKEDSDEKDLGVEPIKLNRPTTNSEVALALRVLEGCCLLCKDCADSTYRYDAIKVLLDILSTRGALEQRACLDALVAVLVSSSTNEMDFMELQGISKVSELMKDTRRDTGIRIKCAEFLLLVSGDTYEKGEKHLLPKIYEHIDHSLGEKCTVLIQAANRYASSLDPHKRQDALSAQARCIIELSNRA